MDKTGDASGHSNVPERSQKVDDHANNSDKKIQPKANLQTPKWIEVRSYKTHHFSFSFFMRVQVQNKKEFQNCKTFFPFPDTLKRL